MSTRHRSPRGGGERPLGLPTIKDRVIQTAAKLVLEPIFEVDMEDCAYGYRPKRSATDAVKVVHKAVLAGYTQVVDADLSKYFDRIPHEELMCSIRLRIADRAVLSPRSENMTRNICAHALRRELRRRILALLQLNSTSFPQR
jgi:retron-type reverse transcriptase